MNNVNSKIQENQAKKDGMLNALDVKLLESTRDNGNTATLDGIRDCTVVCQQNLCCFSEDMTENSRGFLPG